jgi:class 3 adenylate cyclase
MAVAELPSGTVTFLFTDLEGSTRLWQEQPEAMRGGELDLDGALQLAREAVERLRAGDPGMSD